MTYRIVLFFMSLALLTGCVTPTAPAPAPTPHTAPTTSDDSLRTAYPLTITDCAGHMTTYTAAPTAPVTLDPQAYEMMFWLGLGQKQLAAGPQPLPAVPDQFKAQTATVTVLARAEGADYVAKEVLLAAKPDFIYGAYRSGFNGETMFSEEEWAARGVNSYFSFSGGGCQGEDAAAPRVNLDKVLLDIENLGKIFDVQAAAQALIEQMKSDLAAAKAAVGTGDKLRVATFEPGEYQDGRPNALGATSTANAIITLAGGINAFGDLGDSFQQTTWEEFIKRDPQVIIIVAYPAAAPQAWLDGEKLLSEMPALQNVTAIKDKRFVRMIFPEMNFGGVRNVEAVKKLAAILAGQ